MTLPDLAAVAVRILSTGLALEAAGVALFCFAVIPDGDTSAHKRFGIRLVLAAALLTVIQHIVMPARMAGAFSGILDVSLQAFYLGSDAGTAGIFRVLGLGAIIAGFGIGSRFIAMGGAFLVCLSFALMGHTVTYGERWILAPLLLVHVCILAFWFGSLRPLRQVVSRPDPGPTFEQFSNTAVKLVPLILLAGIGLAWGLLPSLASLATPYGVMLAVKLAAFAALIGIAAYNRRRLTAPVCQGDENALRAFRINAMAEWGIIWLVIAVTVGVTSFYSPGG